MKRKEDVGMKAFVMAAVLLSVSVGGLVDSIVDPIEDAVPLRETVDDAPLPEGVEDTVDDTLDDVTDIVDDRDLISLESVGAPVAVATVTVDGETAYLCPTAKEGPGDEHTTDCAPDHHAVQPGPLAYTYSSRDIATDERYVDITVTLVDLGPTAFNRPVTVVLWRADDVQVGAQEVVMEMGWAAYKTSTYDETCECYVPNGFDLQFYKDWVHVTFEDVPADGDYFVRTSSFPYLQDLDPAISLDGVQSQDESAVFSVTQANAGDSSPSDAGVSGPLSGTGMNLATALALAGAALMAAFAVWLLRRRL